MITFENLFELLKYNYQQEITSSWVIFLFYLLHLFEWRYLDSYAHFNLAIQ